MNSSTIDPRHGFSRDVGDARPAAGFCSDPARRAVLAARKGDALEYRLILAGLLPVFLVIEIGARLFPRRGADTGRTTPRGSIWEEAKAAACRAVPLAFMG